MKKTISVLLALVMLFALCVPAFAADTTVDITKDTAQTADVLVKTSTKDGENKDADFYTVTIPADLTFTWGDTDVKNANYTVHAQLLIGASLKVKVESDVTNGNEMSATGTEKKLHYTLVGGAEETFTEVVAANTEPATSIQVSIADSEWAQAPVGEYTGSLTYTVTYIAPTTP